MEYEENQKLALPMLYKQASAPKNCGNITHGKMRLHPTQEPKALTR